MALLEYKLPEKSAQHYADAALAILASVEAEQPNALPLVLRADVVLTLSGVRAFTTYIDANDAPGADLSELQKVLDAHNVALFDDKLEGYQDYPENWNIVHQQAFELVLLPNGNASVVSTSNPIANTTDLLVWDFLTEAHIRSRLAEKPSDVPQEILQDQWAAHNIRFGMLLGYPAAAILSSSGDSTEMAEIAFHDRYNAAHPIYNFSLSVAKDKDIIAHQKLWSDILTYVYESDWHKEYVQSQS